MRDVTAGDQSHAEQVADPLGILFVVLVAFYRRYPFGISNDDVNGIFKDIPDGDPILAGALHTDVFAVVFKQPRLERNETAEKGREPLLVVMRHNSLAGNDCSDEKGFMNIDATANGVCEPHADPPS